MIAPRSELRQAIEKELRRVQGRAKYGTLSAEWVCSHIHDTDQEVALLACGGYTPRASKTTTTHLVVGIVGETVWVAGLRLKYRSGSEREPHILETTWPYIAAYLPDEEVDFLAYNLLKRHDCRIPEGRIKYFDRVGPTSWYVIAGYTPYLSTPYALIRLPGTASSKRGLIHALSEALNTDIATAQKIIEGNISEEELAVLVLAL